MNEAAEKQKSIVLSVIVPAYNASGHIERCLASIAAQRLRRIECIVVDDGSTDDTVEIVQKLISGYPGIKWKLIRQENRGSSQARCAGVREAGGALIGFADADDYVDPGYFEALYACAVKTGADIIAGEFIQEGIQKRQTNRGKAYTDGTVISPEAAKLEMFERTCVYSFSVNKLFKKELLRPDCFPEGKMNGEDFAMVLKALGRASSVALCRENGYHYVTRRGSQTLQNYGETKRRGFHNYAEIYKTFRGTDAEKRALGRHIMLEYMSCVLLMYRSKTHDSEVEEGVLSFVRAHRKDYLVHGKDGLAAKCFAAILNPLTHKMFFCIWPRRW